MGAGTPAASPAVDSEVLQSSPHATQVDDFDDDPSVPSEAILVAQVIDLLARRPGQSLLLSDLWALMPSSLRPRMKDHAGVRRWIQGYPGILSISGQPGCESVTLLVGAGSPEDKGRQSEQTVQPEPFSVVSKSDVDHASQDSADVEEEEPDLASLSALQLRGLPYKATVEDIRAFLGQHVDQLAETDPIHLVLNRDGRSSGFARVQLQSPEAACRCQEALHLRSMLDRYVEIFIYSDRPNKARLRTDGTAGEAVKGGQDGNTSTSEQVVQECRVQMSLPGKQCMLLSMLGEALSAPARAHLKHSGRGLKQFLAQYTTEFSIEGNNGCEHVTYANGLASTSPCVEWSEALQSVEGARKVTHSAAARAAVSPSADEFFLRSPTLAVSPGASGGETPSIWGTPGLGEHVAWGSIPWLPPYPSHLPDAGAGAGIDCVVAAPDSDAAAAAAWGAAAAAAWGAPFGTWPGSNPWDPSTAGAIWHAPAAELDEKPAGSGVGSGAAPETDGDGAAAEPSVRLRGLPFTASEQDVCSFFAQHDVVDRISDGAGAVNLLKRPNGKATGQAVVKMNSRSDAETVQQVLHGQWMGSRYVEVFLDDRPYAPAAGPESVTPAVLSDGIQPSPPGISLGAPPALPLWPGMGASWGAGFPGDTFPGDTASWEAMIQMMQLQHNPGNHEEEGEEDQ